MHVQGSAFDFLEEIYRLTNVGVQKCDPPSPLINRNKSATHHGNHLTRQLPSAFRQQNQIVLFINHYKQCHFSLLIKCLTLVSARDMHNYYRYKNNTGITKFLKETGSL